MFNIPRRRKLQPKTPEKITIHKKPWMLQQPCEEYADYVFRTEHSCYACGTFILDIKALEAHEDQHTADMGHHGKKDH